MRIIFFSSKPAKLLMCLKLPEFENQTFCNQFKCSMFIIQEFETDCTAVYQRVEMIEANLWQDLLPKGCVETLIEIFKV